MVSLCRPWLTGSAARLGGAAVRWATCGAAASWGDAITVKSVDAVQLYAALPLVLCSLLVSMPVATLPGLPVAGLPLGEVQALNRELGRLCADPPRQALSVCRIHARLVKSL